MGRRGSGQRSLLIATNRTARFCCKSMQVGLIAIEQPYVTSVKRVPRNTPCRGYACCSEPGQAAGNVNFPLLRPVGARNSDATELIVVDPHIDLPGVTANLAILDQISFNVAFKIELDTFAAIWTDDVKTVSHLEDPAGLCISAGAAPATGGRNFKCSRLNRYPWFSISCSTLPILNTGSIPVIESHTGLLLYRTSSSIPALIVAGQLNREILCSESPGFHFIVSGYAFASDCVLRLLGKLGSGESNQIPHVHASACAVVHAGLPGLYRDGTRSYITGPETKHRCARLPRKHIGLCKIDCASASVPSTRKPPCQVGRWPLFRSAG